MSLLLLFDEDFVQGKPGTGVEMLFEDTLPEVLMLFEDDKQMVFEDGL